METNRLEIFKEQLEQYQEEFIITNDDNLITAILQLQCLPLTTLEMCGLAEITNCRQRFSVMNGDSKAL